MAKDKDLIKGLTPKQSRIVKGVFPSLSNDDEQKITFSHSTICQTSMPFKDTGDLEEWRSQNGEASIFLQAGKVYDPEKDKTIKLGLPYGAKPRLLLMHLNQHALKQQSPFVEVEESLYQFIKALGIEPTGTEYRRVKDQLGRLAASSLIIGRKLPNGSATTEYGRIVDKMNVFFPKDDRQRLLWPNEIKLSNDYWESLQRHAVPLDQRALHLLKDSALELDLYSMLAERLHRIPEGKGQFIPWKALYDQYGGGYTRIRKFRDKFLQHLTNVKAVYQAAQIEESKTDNGRSKGLTLFHSAPPISKRNVVVLKPKAED